MSFYGFYKNIGDIRVVDDVNKIELGGVMELGINVGIRSKDIESPDKLIEFSESIEFITNSPEPTKSINVMGVFVKSES